MSEPQMKLDQPWGAGEVSFSNLGPCFYLLAWCFGSHFTPLTHSGLRSPKTPKPSSQELQALASAGSLQSLMCAIHFLKITLLSNYERHTWYSKLGKHKGEKNLTGNGHSKIDIWLSKKGSCIFVFKKKKTKHLLRQFPFLGQRKESEKTKLMYHRNHCEFQHIWTSLVS